MSSKRSDALTLGRLCLSIAGITVASVASAQSITNSMTNIVTVADACDIVAIGVDFGVVSPGGDSLLAGLPALGVTGNTPENILAGGADRDHPLAGADGPTGGAPDATGDSGDDNLTINTSLPLLQAVVDPLLSTALDTVIGAGAIPGVVVACTVTPIDVTLESEGGQSTTLDAGAVFTGTMTGVGAGAGAADTLDYSLTFGLTTPDVSAVTGLLAGFTINIFGVSAAELDADDLGAVVPGHYADIAVATVEF